MSNLISCKTCGAQMADSAPSCPSCGALGSGAVSEKSGLIALILCFFLGWLGIHNFYLGRVFRGIIQLVIFAVAWVPLLGWLGFGFLVIWVFFEFIFLLLGRGEDGDGQTVKL